MTDRTSENNETFARIADTLADVGRNIDEDGGFGVEIQPDRTSEDIRENRPGNHLREKILSLPESPGVYMYLDRHGKVIYVGKAKRLKRRVSSYFNRRHDSVRTNLLVRNIVDMRFIVVGSEEDALHLENAMIKEYQPRYNVLLKDDKSYPWIVVTKEEYPRVFMTRERGLDARYYGPYSNQQSARVVLQLIRDVYPLRSCRHQLEERQIARGKFSLCLDYHIGKCGGPCRGLVSKEEYGRYVAEVRQILSGETVSLERRLREEMTRLADEMRFEEAQAVKEKCEAVGKYNAKSVIGMTETPEMDMFAYVEDADTAFVNFMHLHRGAVVQSLNMEFRRRLAETKEEILSLAMSEVARRFGREYDLVVVPFLPDVEFGGVRFTVPQRGDKRKMLDIGVKNATQYMRDKQKQAEKLDPEQGVNRLMAQMKEDFRLNVEPRHIECFDNSNIQGTNPVASCVVFRNGKPAKRDYRHFNIKTVVGADDFASMREIVGRRYRRLLDEGAELPDLIVVDGGKGQLSSAYAVLCELGIEDRVPVVGLAKRIEEVFYPNDPMPYYLSRTGEPLKVICHLRDEAHRFGITFHRQKRSANFIRSELEQIEGIGPKSIETLLRHFRTVARVGAASREELTALVGAVRAERIYDFFHTRG